MHWLVRPFLILAALAPLAAAASPKLTVLYQFQGGTDGFRPVGGLYMDATGALFGTTEYGGPGAGTVFELAPPASGGHAWTYTLLHSFSSFGTSPQDGAAPESALVADRAGNLYGMSEVGGVDCQRTPQDGCGTVFELAPSSGGTGWRESVAVTFTGKNGAVPFGGLTLGNDGSLFGTTQGGQWCRTRDAGRRWGCGEVFALTPSPAEAAPVQEHLLFRFETPSMGLAPFGGVVQDSSGALYGEAHLGNAASASLVVFKLTPPTPANGSWTETVIIAPIDEPPGHPANFLSPLAIDGSGGLFFTVVGRGTNPVTTVVELAAPAEKGGAWKKATIFSAVGGSDAPQPPAVTPGPNGVLHGIIECVDNCTSTVGTIVKLERTGQSGWKATTLYRFPADGSKGAFFDSGLIQDAAGNLYGVAGGGGKGGLNGYGTVFELSP